MTTHIEYHHFVIPITENVQDELKKLIEAGWTPIPGATPIAIWHMQRLQGDSLATAGVRVGVSIKEEGLSVIKSDGTIRGSGGGEGQKMN
jgi:hypothetical protein